MGSLYSEQHTWLHAVPAWLKLVCLALLGTGLFLTDQLQVLLVVGSLCLGVFLSLGQAAAKTRPFLIGLAMACALMAAFHLYMQRPDVAVMTVLRLLSTSLMGVALTVTTRYSDLLHVFERLLSPLQCVGLAPNALALQLALMLRFTEHFFVVWRRLDEAHRLRTGQSGGFKILAPLTIQMLLAARRVADALQLRLRR